MRTRVTLVTKCRVYLSWRLSKCHKSYSCSVTDLIVFPRTWRLHVELASVADSLGRLCWESGLQVTGETSRHIHKLGMARRWICVFKYILGWNIYLGVFSLCPITHLCVVNNKELPHIAALCMRNMIAERPLTKWRVSVILSVQLIMFSSLYFLQQKVISRVIG